MDMKYSIIIVFKGEKKEGASLRRTERTMIRAVCGVKLMDKKNTEELMVMLGLKETIAKLAKTTSVH